MIKSNLNAFLQGEHQALTCQKAADLQLPPRACAGCNGYFPTETEVFYAKEPLGQWTSMGNPAQIHQKRDHTKGYWAQATHMLPMPGGTEGEFILMMDQWKQEDLATSG